MAVLSNMPGTLEGAVNLLDKEQQKTIALAGLFQAAALVQQLARTGEVTAGAYQSLVNSIFVLDPKSVEEIYGGVAGARLGIDTLLKIMKDKETARYSDAIRYSIGILQVEKHLNRNADINSILRSRLEQITIQLPHFDSAVHSSVISKLNDLYLDTFAKFRFRIQVNGDPRHLQREENAAKIRAILLAGVRSAMLWRQLGGSRLQFVFGKRRMLNALESLQQTAALS